MAKSKPKQSRPAPRPVPTVAPEVVDPRWLFKILGLIIAAAAVCAYLSLCFLIYQGAWQLLLHPSAKVARTPAALVLPFSPIRFDAGATGRPRLSGWWIPTAAANAPTLLYLHAGSGSLADTVDQLALLHRAQVNIFALDYRGFGTSDPTHPNQARMTEDANAALEYLTDTRHLAPSAIVPYGVGLGAVLAASLAVAHPDLPAVIVDNPDPDASARVIEDNRSRFIPVRVLMRDHFDLETPLRQLHGPKLLLVGGPGDTHPQLDARAGSLFRSLPDPKYLVTLPPRTAPPALPQDNDPYVEAIRRFLDQAFTAAGKK